MRGIYQIKVICFDGKPLVYIGQSVDLRRRHQDHLSALKRGDHKNRHLQRAYNKYGTFEFTVLVYITDDRDMTAMEQEHIDKAVAEYGRKYVMNLTLAADNPMNDPEVRARSAAAQVAAGRRRAADPKWRAATKAGVTARQAKTHSGLVAPDGTPYPQVYNLEAFARQHNLHAGHLNEVLRGKVSQHKGWRRYEGGHDA